MTYRGRVKDGVVVLDAEASLPEGTEVSVEPVSAESTSADDGTNLGERLMRLAGRAKGLPPDASINHDHYLYGTPRRK